MMTLFVRRVPAGNSLMCIQSTQNKYQRRHDANLFVTGCTACYEIPGRQRHRVGIMATQFFCEGFYLRFFPCLRFRCPWPCRKWRFEVGSSSCHLTGPSDLQHHSLCSDAPPSFLCGMEMDKMKCFLSNLATLGLSMGYENWIGCITFVSGLAVLPFVAMHCGLTWPMDISSVFQRPLTAPFAQS